MSTPATFELEPDADVEPSPARTSGGLARSAVPPPPEPERLDRPDTMRLLGVSHTKLAEMQKKGELQVWSSPVNGREVFYDRAEVEALAGRDGHAGLLRAATGLVAQAQSHQQATLGVLLQAANQLAQSTAIVLDKLASRNAELEARLGAMLDKVREADRNETEQAIRLLETEQASKRSDALLHAAERAVPVIVARLSKGSSAEDAALAAALRALTSDRELVARMRQGLTDEQRVSLDSLIKTVTPLEPTP